MYTANVDDLTKEQLATVINTQNAVMQMKDDILKRVSVYLQNDISPAAVNLVAHCLVKESKCGTL